MSVDSYSADFSIQVFRADHLNVCMVSRPLEGPIAALQVSLTVSVSAMVTSLLILLGPGLEA